MGERGELTPKQMGFNATKSMEGDLSRLNTAIGKAEMRLSVNEGFRGGRLEDKGESRDVQEYLDRAKLVKDNFLHAAEEMEKFLKEQHK